MTKLKVMLAGVALALFPTALMAQSTPTANLNALPAGSASVDSLDPALRAQIDGIAVGVLAQSGVPSASIALLKGGKLVYTHAYGKARLDPPTQAEPEMRYSVGSISKQFTAAAILLLQEQGKLSLDDAVGKYVPGLTRGNEVTLRQVLSHTSGYQDYCPEDYMITPMLKPTSAQYILNTWAGKPLDFEPGTKWQYSNTNYVIAGAIVEKVSGEKLMDFLGEHVFHPLVMRSVWNSDEEKLTSSDAAGYYQHGLGPLRPAPKEGRGWMFSAGELAMTAHDLALWDASIVAQSVLKPASYEQMFTEVKLKDGSSTHYGLGIEVLSRTIGGEKVKILEHSGEVSGFVSENYVLPDKGVAIAVLTNMDASGGASQIAHEALPVLLAGQRSEPNEHAVAEAQALAIFRDLQQGKIDRGLLAPNLTDYFTAEALEDFKSSLGPLGDPVSLRQESEELRGGMTFRAFSVLYPAKKLEVTTYTYPDGKLEQYLVGPAG